MARWSPGDVTIVVGAGATRGAQFIEEPPKDGSPPACLPPLNTDFFTQLQRISTVKHQTAIDGVLRDVVNLYGPNFSLTLEEYFTQLEAMLSTVSLANTTPQDFTEAKLQAMRSRLLDALSAVLEESADVVKLKSRARIHPCEYHRQLVEALRPRDTIVTFNYDCVMDHALRTYGSPKWSAQYGYGFPDPQRVAGHEPWSADAAPTQINRSINLLKLHGSLNWFPFPENENGIIRLRERPYRQRGEKQYEIIPPEYAKSIHTRPIFVGLWGNAEQAIRRARVLAFIGFSFTPTDLHVEALFRIALANNRRIERVVIANPNQDHRRRIRAVISHVLRRREPRLVQFESFRELAPHASSALLRD